MSKTMYSPQRLAELFGVRTPGRVENDIQNWIASYLTLAPIGLTEDQISTADDTARTEVPTADGTRRRIDIEYGRLVIEVKKQLTAQSAIDEARAQCAGYLDVKRTETGDVFAGIVTDGVLWDLIESVDGEPHPVTQFIFDPKKPDSLERLDAWLQAIMATGDRLRVTPARVKARLGADSPRYKLTVARLTRLYENDRDAPALYMKRILWERLLRTAVGAELGQGDDTDRLFIDHTLLVIEAEIIAHLVVGLDPRTLNPTDILTGTEFRNAGIDNVVEADFFDWPADLPGGDQIVDTIVADIAQYDWSNIDHDVLKHLYETVITHRTRHDLGEYYTPDWLAKLIVDQTVTEPLTQRVLDPGCGSGTFLFHAIKAVLNAADAQGLGNAEAITAVTSHVFGMDIHPVAGVLARVTYLLAIGHDRLAADRNTIHVPVALGDSVQWQRGLGAYGADTVSFSVDAEDEADSEDRQTLFSLGRRLAFPLNTIDDSGRFDRLVEDLAELASRHVTAETSYDDCEPILDRHSITDQRDRDTLTTTYHTLADLNADGRNHIWSYYVRNQVRPVWYSLPGEHVDVLVGNPPWVAYRYMTAAMQTHYRAMAEARHIWVGRKVATNQDLVSLFIARTVEQFLADNGRFAWVTPFAVLSRYQFAGFRSAKWLGEISPAGDPERPPQHVVFDDSWDLSRIPNLFPVPAAVVRGHTTDMRKVPMRTTAITYSGRPSKLTTGKTDIPQLDEDLPESPYLGRVAQGATLVPRMVTFVERKDVGPLGHANGVVTVQSRRSELEKRPWKNLSSLQGRVEEQFIRPVHLGETLLPWRLLRPLEAVLPIEDGHLLTDQQIQRHRHLDGYWRQMNDVWKENAPKKSDGEPKLSLRNQLNYRHKLTDQLPLARYRVLYTASGLLAAALCADSNSIIEHKLYWIGVGSEDEGLFLVAILNSTTLRQDIVGYQSLGLMGPRDIDTLPFHQHIPRYDPADSLHAQIVGYAREASNVAASLALDTRLGFQKLRAEVREYLRRAWNHHDNLEAAVSQLLHNASSGDGEGQTDTAL